MITPPLFLHNQHPETMESLAFLLLPPLIGLVLIILVAIWATNVLVHRLIGRKHHWMEEILATGAVPVSWRSAAAAKLAHQRRQGASVTQLKRRQQQLQQHYLRQFDQLIHYARTTALVADEETRQVLVAQLLAARTAWLAQTLDPLENG
jgi:hypothetical protein